MNAVVDDLTNYLGPDPNASGDGGFTKVYQATAGQTWTLSPTMLMDMTFGFGRQDQHVYGPDFQAGNYGLTTLGIPGTNDQGSGDERYAGYPVFNTGFSAVGNRDGWNPIFRDERTYTLSTNLSKMKGRHDFRGGYLMNFFYLDHWQPETGNPRGQFDFNGDDPALNATGAQGQQLLQPVRVVPARLRRHRRRRACRTKLMTAREWQHSFYVRDRWTPTGKLTLDLGLRYELYPIMHRADGRGVDRLDLSNPDFNRQLDVLIAGRGDNPQNNGMSMSWNNFAPRLGAIYRLNEHDGVPHRLRADLQRDAVGARGARRQRLPDHHRRQLPQRRHVRLLADAGAGHPDDRAAEPEQRPDSARSQRGRIHPRDRQHRSRLRRRPGTSRSSAGSCSTPRWTSPTSAPRARDGYAALDINAPTVLGTGNQGRPFFSLGPHQRDQLVGRAAEDDVPVDAGVAEQAVHARPAVQGRLHAQQVDERERQRRPRDADLEHAERAVPQLRAGRLRSPPQLPDGLRVFAALAEQRPSRQRRQGRSSTTGRSTACSRRSAARRSR